MAQNDTIYRAFARNKETQMTITVTLPSRIHVPAWLREAPLVVLVLVMAAVGPLLNFHHRQQTALDRQFPVGVNYTVLGETSLHAFKGGRNPVGIVIGVALTATGGAIAG